MHSETEASSHGIFAYRAAWKVSHLKTNNHGVFTWTTNGWLISAASFWHVYIGPITYNWGILSDRYAMLYEESSRTATRKPRSPLLLLPPPSNARAALAAAERSFRDVVLWWGALNGGRAGCFVWWNVCVCGGSGWCSMAAQFWRVGYLWRQPNYPSHRRSGLRNGCESLI